MKRRVLGLFLAIGILTQLLPAAPPALAAGPEGPVLADLQTGSFSVNSPLTNFTYQKSLSYENGSFILGLHVTAESKGTLKNENLNDFKLEGYADPNAYQTEFHNLENQFPSNGWYLIELWGADGGDGKDGPGTSGGKGGKGGYVYGYRRFTDSDRTLVVIAHSSGGTQEWDGAGTPGYRTVFGTRQVREIGYLTAGGGGGGGGGGNTDGENGQDAVAPPVPYPSSSPHFNVGNGEIGKSNGSWEKPYPGAGGTAGQNYIDASVRQDLGANCPLTDPSARKKVEDAASGRTERPGGGHGGGAFRISFLQQEAGSVQDFSMRQEISEYFNVVAVEGEYFPHGQADGIGFSPVYKIDSTDGGPSVVTISNSSNPFWAEEDQTAGTVTYRTDFTLRFILKPLQNFLGGYDVPVVHGTENYLARSDPWGNSTKYTIDSFPGTDYANVPVPDRVTFTQYDIDYGETVTYADFATKLDELTDYDGRITNMKIIPGTTPIDSTKSAWYDFQIEVKLNPQKQSETKAQILKDIGANETVRIDARIWVSVDGEAPPPPVLSVTIDWGTLEFDYSRVWDPERHAYDPVITPSKPGTNNVTIANKSPDTAVTAVLTYENEADFELEARFSSDEAGKTPLHDPLDISAGTKATAYLWLEGELKDPKEGTYTCGRWNVSIGPSGGAAPEGGETP